MEFLIQLWLPIILCAIVLFFASFAAWVILPHHFSDKKQLPNEDELMDFISKANLPAGNYMFPYAASKEEQGGKEYGEKYAAGPRGLVDIYDMPNMGSNMAQTVVFFLITSIVIAYITFVACPPAADGTDFMKVFRVAGTIGVLTHASSGILNKIWFKGRFITDLIDGIVFGLIIGLIFALLWPGGA